MTEQIPVIYDGRCEATTRPQCAICSHQHRLECQCRKLTCHNPALFASFNCVIGPGSVVIMQWTTVLMRSVKSRHDWR